MILREDVSFVMMVRNEEYWIELALRPLIHTFIPILIMDTGSEDATVDIIEEISDAYPQIKLFANPRLNASELGRARGDLAKEATTSWIFVVDGDEIYRTDDLHRILDDEYPDDMLAGFTTMQNLEFENGSEWVRATNKYSAHRIHKQNAKWVGEYPFESTEHFRHEGNSKFYYYQTRNGSKCHGYHARYAMRSSLDNETFFRTEKIGYFNNEASGPWFDLFDEIGTPIYNNPYKRETD